MGSFGRLAVRNARCAIVATKTSAVSGGVSTKPIDSPNSLGYSQVTKFSESEASRVARPIGIDLFAGAGGMSLGFEQAGFDVAAAVELDPVHAAVHSFNFPNCATICRSVANIDAAYVRRESRIGAASVDVVFGGAPCQGFSMIGKRALDDPRNSLVHHFVRLVVDL